MQGRIVALTAGVYTVKSADSVFYLKARGVFRINNLKPVVGDYVEFDNDVILNIYPRRSYLYRPEVSNIDEILIVHSLKEPDFSYSLIFKYLTYANMNGIKATVVLTKKDKIENISKLDEIKNVFNKIDTDVYFVNSKLSDGVEEIKQIIKGKTIALIGTSCVGKSTLLNAIDHNFNRKEGSYSMSLKGGKHETKEVVLLPFENGFIADTPGFYNLDLNINKEQLAKFYPGMYLRSNECYFSNCLHQNEKKCQIKNYVDNGTIPLIVYNSYISLLNTLEK